MRKLVLFLSLVSSLVFFAGCSGNKAEMSEASQAGSGEVAKESAPAPSEQAVADLRSYKCSICGYVYEPAKNGSAAFSSLPSDWKCPRCGAPKEKFAPLD